MSSHRPRPPSSARAMSARPLADVAATPARERRTSVEQVRVDHRAEVIRALRGQGSMSRVDLADRLQVSSSTVTKLVAELLAAGYVTETGSLAQNGLGRPRQGLQLAGDALKVLSVLVQPEDLSWAVIGLDLRIHAQGRHEFPVAQEPADRSLQEIAKLYAGLTRTRGRAKGETVHAITLAVPGFIDEQMRTSVRAPHIHWQQVAAADALEARTRVPVAVYSNVRAMALAEFEHLRLPEGEPLLFVQTRSGIGAALVSSTATPPGQHVITEIGNIPVYPEQGRGRLEPARLHAVVNEAYLRDHLDFHDRGTEVMVELQKRLDAGDTGARRLHAQTVHYLATGLGIAIDLLNPKRVVLGGVFAHASDAFYADLIAAVKASAVGDLTRGLSCERSALVGIGAQIGAQMAGLDLFFTQHLF